MFTRPISSLLSAIAVAGALTAAALGTAGLADAERPTSSVDTAFLNDLTKADIAFDDPSAAVELAGSVCEAFADGNTYNELFNVTMSETDLTEDQANTLLFDSVWYYCPEFIPDIVA